MEVLDIHHALPASSDDGMAGCIMLMGGRGAVLDRMRRRDDDLVSFSHAAAAGRGLTLSSWRGCLKAIHDHWAHQDGYAAWSIECTLEMD